MSSCFDCPRRCGADREAGETGVCGCGPLPVVARAAPHFGEEPCISGPRGSGTVFFSGCSLGCVYCQNGEISRSCAVGRQVTVPELRRILLALRDKGVHNINLVTATHFVRPVTEALTGLDLGIPVVWNSSGYENPERLRRLEGLVQIYMPDFKYALAAPAARYSAAPDYPKAARAAILEMYRQTGPAVMGEDGLLRSGVLLRHLILPGQAENAKRVIDWTAETFPPDSVLFSLMSQYTPMPGIETRFPELARPVGRAAAARLYDYLRDAGITAGFWQDGAAAGGGMIPAFDLTGV